MEKKNNIIIIGGGGHAKVIIDIIRGDGSYNIVGICDRLTKGDVLGIPILGTDEILPKLYDKGIDYAFIGIGALGDLRRRDKIFQEVKKLGFILPTLIHPRAVVAPSVKLGEGTCIMAGAILNPETRIGDNCIINTGSIIEHDVIIENNCHISPGACICGGVHIRANTHIGARAVVNQGLIIGSSVTVGSGAVVIKDIEDSAKVAGVPAKNIS